MSTDTPPQPVPQADGAEGSEFTFADRIKADTFKSRFGRTSTRAVIPLMLGVVGLILYLQGGNIVVDLPVPEVSYTLLPNEGRTNGVPVAIKVNQIAVFMVNDPLDSGAGAVRAKELVDQLQGIIDIAVEEPGKTLRIDNDSAELPIIVLTKEDGTDSQPVVAIEPEDLVLAGDDDAKRIARTWAERLTDTIKVVAFGEPPKFTSGSEFWEALAQMHARARSDKGLITEDSLNESFDALPTGLRLLLETLPTRPPEELELIPLVAEVSGE